MGPCVICGEKGVSIESIILEKDKAFLLVLRNNYCPDCAAKRIDELKKIVKEKKNAFSIVTSLKYFEELREI